MKLNPKAVKFCPGCMSNLSLSSKAPQLVVKPEEKKKDTKTITILKAKKKPAIVNSLF